MAREYFAVDRIERGRVILIDDGMRPWEVEQSAIPMPLVEGTVLSAEIENGTPDWPNARIDEQERERRLQLARRQLEQMKQRDAGGDVTL